MKKILFILTFASFFTVLHAQDVKNQLNPIYHGVNSLAIAPDARSAGLGDVGAATDPDVNSQYWNPAKYPFCISRAGISLNYTPWLRQIASDIDLANLTGYYRLGTYDALSASLRYFSLGEVSLMDDESVTFKPYEMAVDVAYSRMLSETFSAGVALRYIYSDLAYKDDETSPGSAFAADISLYHNGYINLSGHESQLGWGLNFSNIGSKISYDSGNTSEFIPTNMRFGLSLLVPFDEYNTLTIAADANKLLVPTRPTMDQYVKHMIETEGGEAKDYEQNYSDYRTWLEGEGYYNVSPISGIFKSFHDAPNGFKEELQEIQWSAGLEYAYNNQFFLRAGYHYEHPNKGNRTYFTVGAGFKMSVFSLDAGYVISTAQSNPLDQTLRFSLAFDMDGIGDLLGRRRR